MKETLREVMRKGKKSLIVLDLAGIFGASTFLSGCTQAQVDYLNGVSPTKQLLLPPLQ